MSLTISDITNDPIIKDVTVHTRKALYIGLLIASKGFGIVSCEFMHRCWEVSGVNKAAQNKTVRMFDKALTKVEDNYLFPAPPKAWMFGPLYALSHRPDKEQIEAVFGGKNTYQLLNEELQIQLWGKDEQIKELQDEISEDTRKMDDLREESDRWKTKAWEFYHRLQRLETESRAFQKILDDIKKMAPPAGIGHTDDDDDDYTPPRGASA